MMRYFLSRCRDGVFARLNGLNPCLRLKDVVTRLPSHPINGVAELLPLATYK